MVATATARIPRYEEGVSAIGTEPVTKPSKVSSNPETQEIETGIAQMALMSYGVPFRTDNQVSAALDRVAAKGNLIIFSAPQSVQAARSSIAELPKTKILTTFEPHLRLTSIRKLRSLVEDYRQAIGHPQAGVLSDELRIALTETYRESIRAAETRNFGTAISMLQDFLRPHWSTVSPDKLLAIGQRLEWLGGQDKLDARLIDKFHSDLAGILGSRISFIAEPDDSEEDSE